MSSRAAADSADTLPGRGGRVGEVLSIDPILSMARDRRADEQTDVICEWIIVAILPDGGRQLPQEKLRVGQVKRSAGRTGIMLSFLVAFGFSGLLTGCQTTIGGQTLPSPDYLSDDVQYFPAGPEMPLANKVAAQRKYQAEQDALRSP